MMDCGYTWTLRPEGGVWRWRVLGRDDGAVMAEGLAGSRAEGAALLIRALARGAAGLELGRAA